MEPWELHSMARRYLMDRHDELTSQYDTLPNQGRVGEGYSLDAKRVFPRYNVVEAMLVEVERLDPDRLPAVEPLGAALLRAAETARSPFTEPPMGQVEAEAIAAERRRFAAAVQNWLLSTNLAVEPLGYQRVLGEGESAEWRRRVASEWGLQTLSWYPMLADPVPENVLVLREESMWDGPGVDMVRRVLRELGRHRVVELREYGPEYIVDVGLFASRYTGAEGVWTDDTLDWLAFASHEGTVAFGGTLAALLETTWPSLGEWRWRGW